MINYLLKDPNMKYVLRVEEGRSREGTSRGGVRSRGGGKARVA